MRDLIVQKDPKSPISEAYRTLRTNIQFASFDRDINVVLVTSSGPGEGKSTTASNLALTMAQTGKRVLLVDCDLRKPSLHRKFKVSNAVGLTDLLVNEECYEEAFIQYADNLVLLTAGTIPPNPAEMLGSKKMRAFLEKIKGRYEFIILDTPPVNAVTDAQILSTMSDGVLLVLSSTHVDREAAIRAKELLLKVKANIIGAVLNKLDVKSVKGYDYSYYGVESKKGSKK